MSNNSKRGDASRIKGSALVEIRGLKIEGFSDDKWHPIIKGIDLDLKRGEVLGLIGESGAGKSTLGLAAMGYTKPGCRISAGSIMFDGKELVGASQADLRSMWGSKISYVAQSASASFNPAHRLMEQVTESAVNHNVMERGAAEADAKDLFKRLQLPNPDTIGTRYPHQVSGGQLQRAMTAMAMSCRPDLIVFDEPTTALDVTTQVEVLASMRRIVEEFNTAAIYITHDLAVVAQMAHRIMVLRYGNLVEQADTRVMLKAPTQDYTKSLWAVRSLEKPEEKSNDIALAISGVDASYSGIVKVLDNVTVRLPRGKTVAVVGESGSGKSTLARAITGLLPPSKGRIEFNGKSLPAKLQDRDRDTLRRIQMIYQSADTALNPRQKVRDIIGRPLEFYLGLTGRAKEDKIIALLKNIELNEDFIDRYPGEMSGGQKQRISIARALAAEPDIIICDEVTSALDQIVQEDILKLLMKLQKETNVSYLFITHDIATVRAISDEIVVMYKGKVVQQGLKSEVLNPPYPAYTELLLSSVPQMDPDWLTGLLKKRSGATA
jgi:peptide/nickel transport system ATP-binding protein